MTDAPFKTRDKMHLPLARQIRHITGALWTMRATALGLAAIAIAVQTIRWIIAKTDFESEDGSPPDTPTKPQQQPGAPAESPFRKASLELPSTPSSLEKLASRSVEERPPSVASPSRTEPANSPQTDEDTALHPAAHPAKLLRFQDSQPTVYPSDQLQSWPEQQGQEVVDSNSSGSDDFYQQGADEPGLADAAVHVQTPDSSKGDTSFLSSFSPKGSAAEPERSPYDVASSWPSTAYQEDGSKGSLHASIGPSRHVKQPSFPEIDYEPEQALFGGSQGDGHSMAPAPTEEGDAIARVEEVLADLEEQAMLGAKRHSRSFSEPNLAAKVVKQQLQAAAKPAAQDQSSEEDDTFPSHREGDSQSGAQDGEDRAVSRSMGSLNGSRASYQYGSRRSRDEGERPPLLQLEILSGPSSGREVTIDDADTQVTIGRTPDNHVYIEDREVSGKHALLKWDKESWAWQARDMGSMNGTRQNGNFISNAARRPGRHYRLSSDDILLLGSRTAIKVIYLPSAVLPHVVPQNLRRLYAPPSSLRPTLTIKSEAMADLRAELSTEKAFEEAVLRLQGAIVCRRGVEHQRTGGACEDVPFCGETGRHQVGLYCIFDGHIGRKSASSCAKLLPEELRTRMADLKPRLDSGEGVGQSWEDVFLATDSALESASTEDGTTATAVLVWNDRSGNLCLQSANVGDSAAVFCHSGRDPKTESVKLTVDHRISDPGEKQRLAAMGIELGKNKTRLYGLNLSRCLGDHFIKAADLGFTAVPSVSEVLRLGPSDSGLVVIASDGLWDVAEPGRVMQVAFNAQDQPESSPETIADAVYQHAMKQRSRDDVCIIVLDIAARSNPMD